MGEALMGLPFCAEGAMFGKKREEESSLRAEASATKTKRPSVETFLMKSRLYRNDSEFPKAGKDILSRMEAILSGMDFSVVSTEDLAKLERGISIEIPKAAQAYFAIPKAHAVSVVLENGKTAKQTFVDQLGVWSEWVAKLGDEAVSAKTKALLEQHDVARKVEAKKIDFFDM